MPVFAKGEERNKLIILALNQALNIELTSEQIYRAVFEGNYMSYFDYQNVMYELEEDGWIAAILYSPILRKSVLPGISTKWYISSEKYSSISE